LLGVAGSPPDYLFGILQSANWMQDKGEERGRGVRTRNEGEALEAATPA
jgi:hypothetical protein